MPSRLNLIIFGATGFTGKYAVEEVHRISKQDPTLTWAIAGRTQSKLDKILSDLQKKSGDDLSGIKSIVADLADSGSLVEMTRQATVVVNCCGPYQLYGEAVVKACLVTKTSVVDISVEPMFIEKMQLHYQEAAERAGIYIVSACGVSSIPADLGVIYLQQHFKGEVNSAEAYFKSFTEKPLKLGHASIHYGTWESIVDAMASMQELGPLRRQLFPVELPNFTPRLKKRSLIHKNSIEDGWFLPFFSSDEPCVYRSQRHLYEKENKRPVQMNAYIAFPSLLITLGVLFVTAVMALFSMFSCGRRLLLKHPKLFTFGCVSHEGPSEEDANNVKFTMTIHGEGWDEMDDVNSVPPNKRMKVRVSGTNPGYGATCTFLLFSAIAILKESDKMPGRGGVLAPGVAFAKTSLIENLQKSNIEFAVIN